MANYSALKAAVQAVVKTNGNQEITGANMQATLLSIIDSLGNGYQLMGVATPSTTPPSSPDYNIAYIAGAGSYTNFGTAVVIPPTNIAIFKYNGSWACEQVTVENGGVFDITAYNNNTTYADLAAALGTNGANVPESVRKGGMSVKFVCSSDNKYVQYRLMSDTFNTTVANWQGVDEEPTAGSDNLVRSGGIEKYVEDAFNLIVESEILVDSELTSEGNIAHLQGWSVSGKLQVASDLNYKTNIKDSVNIYCYTDHRVGGSPIGFLGRVQKGSPLIQGTKYVRINWITANGTPYFYSKIGERSLQAQIISVNDDIEEINDNISTNNKDISIIKNELFDNLNKADNFRIGYEVIRHSGNYSSNPDYTSSGNIPVSSLEYDTDYIGNIFCYNEDGYIGYVQTGTTLLEGTTYIRLNWLSANDAPYFYSVHEIPDQRKTDAIIPVENNKVNAADMLGYELQSTGNASRNPLCRTSRFVYMKYGYTYKCNVSRNYYFYDAELTYIDRVSTNAGTVFSRNTMNGAVYMRTNTTIDEEIKIYEYLEDNLVPFKKDVFNGLASGINEEREVSEKTILPLSNSNVVVKFKTTSSLYKLSEETLIANIGKGLVTVKAKPVTIADSYYTDKSEVDIVVNCAGNVQTIPLRLNNYGQNVFSLRLKYPEVTLNAEGKATIITAMPASFQGMYIRKTSSNFTIYNGDDTVFKDFVLANYTDLNDLVDSLMNDSDITDNIEVVKYGCNGISFADINNFDKIYLSKEIDEIYYGENSQGQPIYTGATYWDSYPTYIRTSDIRYEHVLRMSYKVLNNMLTYFYISLDGMFLRFDNKVSVNDFNLALNTSFEDVISINVSPYKAIATPMLSMQHNVVEEDVITDMVVSSNWLYNELSYLQKNGFSGVNFDEAISLINNGHELNAPVYCLTYDDRRKHLWTDVNIRNIFNHFRAKPTLVELIYYTQFNDPTPTGTSISSEEYKQMRMSGWGVISHGFCIHTNLLSYSQFVYGFNKIKELWQLWYNEDIQCYNPHGAEITDYQFYFLKELGYGTIASGSAKLGWFCEIGTTIDVQYKRVVFLEGAPRRSWKYVTENIDKWKMQ